MVADGRIQAVGLAASVAIPAGATRIDMSGKTFGSIAPGKRADLLVLNGNPLDDIRNTRQVHSVWEGGHRLPEAH